MKKYWIMLNVVIIILSSSFLVSCDKNNIGINGEFEDIIEVGDNYTDPGVSCSDKYKVVVDGQVNSEVVGKYELKYKIYDDKGELKKELSRYVLVKDSKSPTFVENKDTETLYVGVKYAISTFVTSYTDNYDSSENITINPSEVYFSQAGYQNVTISFEDTSGNKTTYNKSFNVVLDVEKMIKEAYKNQPYKVTTSTVSTYNGGTQKMVNVSIDSKTSFAYFESGSVHYLKKVTSAYGTSASIQISAINIESFGKASVDYNISNGTTYSVGFIYNFDATRNYNSFTINKFNSTINNLELNESDMVTEFNAKYLDVLNEFQNYMSNTIGYSIII